MFDKVQGIVMTSLGHLELTDDDDASNFTDIEDYFKVVIDKILPNETRLGTIKSHVEKLLEHKCLELLCGFDGCTAAFKCYINVG